MYPRQYLDMFREAIEPTMVFVGMSFDPVEQWRWDQIIRTSIENAGLQPYRVDTEVVGGSIMDDIVNGIARAKILVFDVSIDERGVRNGNVLYELGIAHAVRYPEEILIVRSDTAQLLFDVANVRVHNYNPNEVPESVDIISGMLKRLEQEIDSSKNLILDRLVSMFDEVTLGLLNSHAKLQYFSLTEQDKAFELKTIEVRSAIRRLLEMGVLSTIWRQGSHEYAYTWTPMGLALLRKMGFLGIQKPEDWL